MGDSFAHPKSVAHPAYPVISFWLLSLQKSLLQKDRMLEKEEKKRKKKKLQPAQSFLNLLSEKLNKRRFEFLTADTNIYQSRKEPRVIKDVIFLITLEAS